MKTKRKILYSALLVAIVPVLSSCSIANSILGFLARAASFCNSWLPTNFTPFTKWISDDGKSVMYCMTNRYMGYGYAYKDGEKQLFVWQTNLSKQETDIDLGFYFPSIDRYAYMTESSGDGETITVTNKPHPKLSSCKFEWSSTLKKVEISEEELDIRYAGQTIFTNEELGLKFQDNFPYGFQDDGVHVLVSSTKYNGKLYFTDQYHFKMKENGSEKVSSGSCKLSKEKLTMTFDTDEIFECPGKTFAFRFEDRDC